MKKNSDLVTKKDLKKAFEQFKKIDLKEAFDEYDVKNRGYRDEVLTGIDGVMKELETMRQENTVGTYQTRELRKEVDKHEQRITKLESSAKQ